MYSFTIPNQYRSTVVIKLSDYTLRHRTHLPLEDIIEEMKRQAIVIRPAGADEFTMSFVTEDARQAPRAVWLQLCRGEGRSADRCGEPAAARKMREHLHIEAMANAPASFPLHPYFPARANPALARCDWLRTS